MIDGLFRNFFGKKIRKFPGGVKLPGFKSLSNNNGIQTLPLPPLLVIPLKQHIGEPAKPRVRVGEQVYKGQIIADSAGYVSAPVHASSSGVITAIEDRVIPHISVIKEPCIVIQTDGQDEWHPDIRALPHASALSAEEMRQRIREAGIVGLGGAVFPSSVKLTLSRDIQTLIVNGVECEPYITCDDVLMSHHADTVIQGILILARILNPREIVVAVEDNKPRALQAVTHALAEIESTVESAFAAIRVAPVPTVFPAGGEKQLIKVLTGKEVPSGGLPLDIGVVCLNVATAAAVYDAVCLGRPLLSRVVTVTGESLASPGNYRVLLGTPIESVLNAAGIDAQNAVDIIMGGPMMGMAIADKTAPVIKAANCLLIKSARQIRQPPAPMPCIRCGQCASVCPMKLLPQQLYWQAQSHSLDKLARYHLGDCIECGCCQVVCPAQLPLVHYFRYAKSELKARELARVKAEVSRRRSEDRQQRLENARREQEERKARRKANRQNAKPEATGNTPLPSSVLSARAALCKPEKLSPQEALTLSRVNQADTLE